MRLLVLTHNYIRNREDFAGLFIHTLNKSLLERGHSIFVISPHESGLDVEEDMEGVHVRRFRYATPELESLAYRGTMHDMVRESLSNKILFLLFMMSFLYQAVRNLLGRRFDLIHAHWWFPGGFIAYVSSLLLNIPYVLTIHGTDAQIIRENRFLAFLFRKVVSRSLAVVVSSEYLKGILLESFENRNLDRERIHKIPMPVQIPLDTGTSAVERDAHTILSVARLTAQKNLKVLIEALALLKYENVTFKAFLVGDGPLRRTLEDQISDAGLGETVKILPGVDRLALFEHYRKCAVFVLPSVREGLGLVLAEALLMKQAVIASNSGGGTEIIEDGISGILFDPDKPDELAAAIKKLFDDSSLARNLSENGYRKAFEMFTPATVGEKYSSVYECACAR